MDPTAFIVALAITAALLSWISSREDISLPKDRSEFDKIESESDD